MATSSATLGAAQNQNRPLFWGDTQIGYVDKDGLYHGSTVDGDGNLIPPKPEPTPFRDFLLNLWNAIRKPTPQELLDFSNKLYAPRALLDFMFSPAFAGELPGPTDTVYTDYTAARNWIRPSDPLILDLDGDGVEATAIDPAAPVLFDHNADGSRTATGWIKADDGIVVMDLNGNGTIDTGRELFGDNTFLPNGQLATNGFQAIAQYDLNGNGKIDSQDAAYSQLRVWQDANQDGISQASELKTLSQLGIASINVTGTASTITLGNGNSQPWSGSFTRLNGTTGASGTPELSGSLLLASNNFIRVFTDDPVVTDAAAALPQMTGSGWVRDLRQAMSLGTDSAQALQNKVAQFAAAATHEAQMVDSCA